MYLTEKEQYILKFLHIIAMSSWVGGALSVLLMVYMAPTSSSDEELFGMLRASIFINQYVVVSVGAIGTFFTGLAYSLCTHRGFFRHGWIFAKWAITLGMLLFGIFYLGRWAGQELDAVYQYGLTAYTHADIAFNHACRLTASLIYSVLLLILIGLSVFKPGEGRFPPKEKKRGDQSPSWRKIRRRK